MFHIPGMAFSSAKCHAVLINGREQAVPPAVLTLKVSRKGSLMDAFILPGFAFDLVLQLGDATRSVEALAISSLLYTGRVMLPSRKWKRMNPQFVA